MAIHLESRDLVNTQQLEVAVNGPDGATHLVLCTGIAMLNPCNHEIFTFLVGPQFSPRQFVGVTASGALSMIQVYRKGAHETSPVPDLITELIAINAIYDEESGQVRVNAEVASNNAIIKFAISYGVNILAELPMR